MINTKRTLTGLVLLITSFFSIKLFPNGGPVDGSTLKSSGNILLKNVKNVELVSEKIFFKPSGDFMNVEVIYDLKNNGEQQSVDYGFPFYSDTEYGNQNAISPSFFKNEEKYEEEKNIIKYFSLKINGREMPKKELYEDKNETTVTKWYVAKIELAKGNNTITVSYSVKTCFSDWATSKSKFTGVDKRRFSYILTPAGFWGNGTTGKLEVFVDSTDIVNKKGTIKFKGITDFKKSGPFYQSSSNNFNFSKSSPFEIEYDIAAYYNGFEEQVNDNKTADLIKTILSSSELKGDYSVKNLTDNNYDSAWAEGVSGNGEGEWIEFIFNGKSDIKLVAIANGYWKTKELYSMNSKIKKMKCEITAVKNNNQDVSFVKFVEAKIPEYNFIPSKEQPNIFGIGTHCFTKIVSADDFDYEYSIKSVKITILEVYPGTKYEDTCISEIIAY
ncbi:MAG: hypothetical protein KA015_05705 [Spirochaetes bacterium]|nr:hypothetical protein [Spirochaetota bacterium]